MTTIIGIEGTYGAVIGCDLQASDGMSGRKYNMNASKLRTLSPGVVVGVAGDLRAVQHLSRFESMVRDVGIEKSKDLSRHEIMCEQILPVWKNYLRTISKKPSAIGLFGVYGQLFEVGASFDVAGCTSGVLGVGTGGDIAVGAVMALLSGKKKGKISCRETTSIATKSLEIAHTFDLYTGKQIDFKWSSILGDTVRERV